MKRIDATSFLSSLIGLTIFTLTGRSNKILRIEGSFVTVGTTKSPAGKPRAHRLGAVGTRPTSDRSAGRHQRRLGRLPECIYRRGPVAVPGAIAGNGVVRYRER